MIVDAHLDLAYNAMLGRDLTLSLADLRASDPLSDLAAVSFDSLREGGVGLCLGTLFAMPQDEAHPWGYGDWRGAREQMKRQLEIYLRWQDGGHIVLLTDGAQIAAHARGWSGDPSSESTAPLGVVLLIEGAEGLKDADDLPEWVSQGVRVLGPAWARGNRFTGGNHEPAPLTGRGEDLLTAMRELNVTLDVSHLPEVAFERASQLQPKLIATHSNARSLVPGERQLSGGMLETVAQLGSVVGTVLYDKFLKNGWERGDARPPLEIVGEMVEALAGVVGWDKIGIGSDLDGGFGVHELPRGLESAADLPSIGEVLPDEHRDAVLGGNWLRWLGKNL